MMTATTDRFLHDLVTITCEEMIPAWYEEDLDLSEPEAPADPMAEAVEAAFAIQEWGDELPF